jgi:hypothetical protein
MGRHSRPDLNLDLPAAALLALDAIAGVRARQLHARRSAQPGTWSLCCWSWPTPDDWSGPALGVPEAALGPIGIDAPVPRLVRR